MKHIIRQHVINEYGLPTVKHTTIQGELGSGVLDKNGVEIFEGDIVTYGVHKRTVCWDEGEFVLRAKGKPDEPFYNFFSEDDCQLEVIGHAED